MSVCYLTASEKVSWEGSAGSCHMQSPAGSSGGLRINYSVTKTTGKINSYLAKPTQQPPDCSSKIINVFFKFLGTLL